MSNSIPDAIRASSKPCLIPFIVGGHATMGAFEEALLALDTAGAPVIEVGIPFSDPIADGPVIAQAMHQVLAGGTTARGVLACVKALRERCQARLVAMVSASITTRLGESDPALAFAAAGFDGIIVPDLDPDEASHLAVSARRHSIGFIPLVAPTTEPARAATLASMATGFVYAIARKGITGGDGQASLDLAEVSATVGRIRGSATVPVAVGFGLSSAADVTAVTQGADAAIVGTPFVRAMSAGGASTVAALYRQLTGTAASPR
ncbi:MAG: tryptophan synthase subunit alpha [Planctomycetota bacterium]|nr:tryptophan synthase subunit alpha [Planctomycetota bacterium]MDA1106045.1 tryptophan synthase subunit alpha [Planctomycetota bacterium]